MEKVSEGWDPTETTAGDRGRFIHETQQRGRRVSRHARPGYFRGEGMGECGQGFLRMTRRVAEEPAQAVSVIDPAQRTAGHGKLNRGL